MRDKYEVKKVETVKHISFGNDGLCSYKLIKGYDFEGRTPDTQVDLSGIDFWISKDTEQEFHEDLKKLIEKHFI